MCASVTYTRPDSPPRSLSYADRVVVKARHSVRDPNPVLTYQTDDITLQGNFNLEEFEVSVGVLATDVCTSSIQIWGSTSTVSLGEYRVVLTDTCGLLNHYLLCLLECQNRIVMDIVLRIETSILHISLRCFTFRSYLTV